jgi:hypoxanthine phosphoribosyltransferase
MGSFRAANIACIEGYKNGIETSIEVMVVTAWFPEAARLLRENPGIDVGLHFTITSEWDNVKWRPLTHCPSLVDEDGYFWPMMSPNKAYPGRSVAENKWSLKEIEQEARAQIEMALRHIPHISHISGHMGSLSFAPQVGELMKRLEFNCQIVSTKLTSYEGTSSTCKVKQALGLTADLTGKRVIIVEDIVDTGNTIVELKRILAEAGASASHICTLLLKPEAYTKDIPIDYVAMEIPNEFIVGFGLDYDELGRNYKDIYVLDM